MRIEWFTIFGALMSLVNFWYLVAIWKKIDKDKDEDK